MITKTTTTVLVALAVSLASAASAAAHRVRQTNPGFAQTRISESLQAPRMIEISPGTWRSNYDPCHCDGGY